MTKTRSTKRALLSSVLALFLCFSMLLGTTYAWFTDSVTSANNVIKSGNLDVTLEYWNGTEWADVEGKSDILTNSLWEPGVTEVAYFRLKNAGSLALKYQLGVNIVSETAGVNQAGDEFKLSDYIQFGVVENVNGETGAYATREAAVAAVTEAKKISAGYFKAASMIPGAELYLALVVYMPTTVGNVANHNGTNVPEINLGINVIATQVESEEDSFGNDYDNGAYIPVAPETKPEAGESLTLAGSVESKVAVTLPATVLADIDAAVTSLAIEASAPVVDTNNKTVSFTTVELVDQNGEEVDLSNSTAKVTVKLFVGDAFAEDEQVEVYHDGAFVTYAVVDADGYISYEVSHFCEVEVKAAEEVVLDNTIDSVKEFIAFANAVNAGKSYAGETVTLGADLDLAGVTWTPIGTSASPFKGTFDGNGKVIKNLSVLMAGKSDVGLFGVTMDGKVENVTVENAKVAGRLNVGVVAGTPYTTTYTNITVKGLVEVDGMAYVGAVGGKNAYANWDTITVAVEADSYVNANSVENGKAYRTYVGGVVGFNGEGGHTFKNITSNINVYGSTCDVGGAFGIAHYDNKFENITVTGNVTITNAAEADEAEEMGGIAGVWHNETGTSVTFTKCSFAGKLTANVAADLSNNTIVGAAYSKTGNGILVIDGVEYVASAAALKAKLNGGASEINLGGNIALNETIHIASGKSVTLNLNGNTITGTLSGTGNQDLFDVKGNFTVENGTITLKATQNQGWNAMSSIFNITAGGVVTLNDVVADNLGGTDMNFVAHLNNWGTATLNVNSSTLKATYVAVRVFNSGYDMNTVVIENSTVTSTGNAAFWVHNYTAADFGTQEKADAQAKLLNFTFNNVTFEANKAAFRLGMTNAEYYTADGSQVVSTADEFVAALEAKKDVVFANNITIDPANMSNAYGTTGINVKYGQTIDGNGYTLHIKGAGGTWDSGINTTGGIIKNITVTGSFRGIFINHTSEYKEKVVLENVVIGGNGTVYTISCDQGLYQGIEATNCTFNGWTSFATTAGEAKFINCSFGEGSGYKYCRPYSNTEFVNCTFSEGYAVDTTCATVTFTDCANPNG